MGRRTVLLLAAVLIAAFGTSLVFLYAHDANARALSNQRPTKVLTVKHAISAGTSVASAEGAGDFILSTLPRSAVAVGALSQLGPIMGDTALSPLAPGEQVISAAFGAAVSTSALPLPAGDLAVSVQLTDPTRVAGFLQPGSMVAVFLDVNPQSSSSGQLPNVVRLLVPQTTVLAVGPTSTVASTHSSNGQTNTQQVSQAIVTLAVDQHNAERLIFGAEQGTLYFTLVNPASKVAPDGGVTIANLFG
jgi:pilus assembly protein CpaB